MTPKTCYPGAGIPAWWARWPFGLVADSAPDGCCEGLYNGVFWWGPGTRCGEEVCAGAREGTELKISLAAPAALCRGPWEPAGKRRLGIGHRDRSYGSRRGTAPLAHPAAPGEKQLCIPRRNSFASRCQQPISPPWYPPGAQSPLALSRFTFLQPLANRPKPTLPSLKCFVFFFFPWCFMSAAGE